MEKRLEKRYEQLVRSHMHTHSKLAAGIKSHLKEDTAFTQTQAAWRFLNNENCTLIDLSKPLLTAAHELCKDECSEYALVAHDWSHLFYGNHKSKQDTYATIKRSIGYQLQTSLLLSDKHGGPLSVVAINLKDKNRIYRSYSEEETRESTRLEELSAQTQWMNKQGFNKKLVHIVDREGDSIGFLRALEDSLWLIRANGNHKVHDGSGIRKVQDIGKDLIFNEERIIDLKGKKALQKIAETQITIIRPAKPKKKKADGKRTPVIKGIPITCRLVVSKIVDMNNNELAIWYLLSNIAEVNKATLALWYFWRWSIESYFKLMKSAGMQLESWQQTTGIAIARRILIASMACVWVWRIAHATGPQATEIRKVLVRLSGRQMKWKTEFTYPALFAGLWNLLAMDDMLNSCGQDKIKSLISSIFGDKRLE